LIFVPVWFRRELVAVFGQPDERQQRPQREHFWGSEQQQREQCERRGASTVRNAGDK